MPTFCYMGDVCWERLRASTTCSHTGSDFAVWPESFRPMVTDLGKITANPVAGQCRQTVGRIGEKKAPAAPPPQQLGGGGTRFVLLQTKLSS